MKILKQLLFMAILTVCTSCAAFAQDRDDKKPPPKGKPPVIVVGDRDKDKPKGDDRRGDENRNNDRNRDNDRRKKPEDE